MFRSILIPLLAAAILVVFALPPGGSAQAQKTPDTNATNLNSSRSNVDRMGGGGGKGTGAATTTGTDRMGGGGGGKGANSTSTDRMGGKSGAKGAGSPGN
jgi:hypothetical protein